MFTCFFISNNIVRTEFITTTIIIISKESTPIDITLRIPVNFTSYSALYISRDIFHSDWNNGSRILHSNVLNLVTIQLQKLHCNKVKLSNNATMFITLHLFVYDQVVKAQYVILIHVTSGCVWSLRYSTKCLRLVEHFHGKFVDTKVREPNTQWTLLLLGTGMYLLYFICLVFRATIHWSPSINVQMWPLAFSGFKIDFDSLWLSISYAVYLELSDSGRGTHKSLRIKTVQTLF